VKPVLQALLLADRIYEEKNGKKIIAGTFNKLIFRREGASPKEVDIDGVRMFMVPAGMRPGSPYAFVSLTDVRNTVECVLRYVDLTRDQPLFEMRFQVECKDPLETVELVLPMPEIPLQPGVHALELLCDNEPMGAFRLIVEEIASQEP